MKKCMSILLYSFLFVIVFGISVKSKIKDIFGEELFAAFSLAGETAAEPLSEDEVTKEIIDIKYMKADGSVDMREMIVYRPADADGNIPLVYIPHYTTEELTTNFITYIRNGWAVASAYRFQSEYNGVLATDDLVFNNAALYTIRHMDGIDRQRIAIVGGSAGGYMTLMLGGLQMGNVCAIANSPITNVYYNAHEYFPACDEVNRNSGLFHFTMPVQGLVSKSFQPVNRIIDSDDVPRWEAVSPISFASAYSSPLVITHNTSDILVPMDQVTHRYVYEHNDGTLPEGFDCHLPSDYPGILSRTFEEMADPNELTIIYIQPDNMKLTGNMPYADTLITIDVVDDGAPTAKGSHNNPALTGALDIFPYLEEMMNRSLAGTEELVPAKLLLLLERYQGRSIALPAHEGVDDTVYGSLVIYQQEIVDELNVWIENHSAHEIDATVREAIATLSLSEQTPYITAWEEILRRR